MKGKNKTGGILGGIILVIIGICLLWYNEGRTVKTQKAISEARKTYIEVKSDKVDSKNEGKLIATNGKIDLTNTNELVDDTFGIKVKSAKMIRTVEMYQWTEECSTDDNNNEHCEYKKEWKAELVDSSEFKESGHSNPTSMPYENNTYLADNVKLGAFTLSKDLQDNLSTDKSVGNEQLTTEYINKKEGLKISGNYIDNIPESGTPEIGNIRISFKYNDSDSATVLAVQNGETFSKFIAKSGKAVYRIKEGVHTGAEILQDMTNENNFIKWLLRILGIILIIGGINSLFAPLQKLANFVPILGGLVGFASGLVSFVLGLAISLVVIALAWFRFRPLLSIILIVIVVGLVLLLKKMKNKTPEDETKKDE